MDITPITITFEYHTHTHSHTLLVATNSSFFDVSGIDIKLKERELLGLYAFVYFLF